jgi:WD40 repeat protein
MRKSTYLLVMVLLMACPNWVRAYHGVAAAFSPDGSILATAGHNCTLILVDTATGRKITTLYKPRKERRLHSIRGIKVPPIAPTCDVLACCFSPDGSFLASQRSNEPIILWNVKKRRKAASLGQGRVDRTSGAVRLEFSKDARLLTAVAVAYDRKEANQNWISVWEVATRKKLLHVRAGRRRTFDRVTLSPDGKTLVAFVESWTGSGRVSTDTIRTWDVKSGKELVTLKGYSARFSPDGRFLLVLSSESPNKLLDIRKGAMHLLKESGDPIQQPTK